MHGYDLAGRLKSIDNANPTSATEPDFFIANVDYNERGQPTVIKYHDDRRTQYTYEDKRGWVKKIAALQYGASPLSKEYFRRSNDMITSTAIVDAASIGRQKWTYSNDGFDLTLLTEPAAGHLLSFQTWCKTR